MEKILDVLGPKSKQGSELDHWDARRTPGCVVAHPTFRNSKAFSDILVKRRCPENGDWDSEWGTELSGVIDESPSLVRDLSNMKTGSQSWLRPSSWFKRPADRPESPRDRRREQARPASRRGRASRSGWRESQPGGA